MSIIGYTYLSPILIQNRLDITCIREITIRDMVARTVRTHVRSHIVWIIAIGRQSVFQSRLRKRILVHQFVFIALCVVRIPVQQIRDHIEETVAIGQRITVISAVTPISAVTSIPSIIATRRIPARPSAVVSAIATVITPAIVSVSPVTSGIVITLRRNITI